MGIEGLITFSMLLLSAITVFGQILPKPVNQLVKNLRKKGADTILMYITGCDGCFIKGRPANCNCFKKESITQVSLVFIIKSEQYREDFSCCQESSLIKMEKSLSLPYFLSLRDTLQKRDEYYKQAAKRKEFFPPIATDVPYEEIELIMPGQNYEVSLSSWQIDDGYKEWKRYFWIDSEIKLMDFVRKDMGISTHTN